MVPEGRDDVGAGQAAAAALALLRAVASLLMPGSSPGGLAAAMPELFGAIATLVPLDSAACYVVDEAGEYADIMAEWHADVAPEWFAATRRVRVDAEPFSRVLRDGETAVFTRGEGLAAVKGVPLPFASAVSVPVRAEGRVAGALNLGRSSGPSSWAPSLDVIEQVAVVLGEVLHNLGVVSGLRDADLRHRELFRTMGMGVVYQSSDGRIIDANPAAQEMLGLTLDQLQGRTSMDPRWRAVRADRSPCPGEEHPAMVALRTGRPVTAQVMGVFSPSTGSYRWLLVTATPEFREGQATPWRVFTTFADITEVYEAERRLEASEDKYRRLAENAPVIIYRLNLSPPSVDYISPAAVRLMGYSPEELYGDPGLALRLIHPDDAGVLQDMATGNEGLDGPVELRWVTRSGDVVVTEQHMFVVRDDEGRPTALEGVALDVSARRAAEDEVRRTLTVLQATLESVAEGIVVADLEDDWLVVNSQFTDMWGLPATGESRPAIRRRTEAFGALKDPVAFASLFAELHDDPAATWAGDVGFRDGRVLAATSRPLFIAGEINGRVWSYRDVTVTRVAEQETRELAARLSRTLDGALSAMGGVVELRDPYTSGHQKRTAALAEAIAVEMGLPARVIHTIRVAASIHDIGQLLVPAEVLTRPRSLTAVEMELVKGHAAAGYDVLSRIAFDAPIADVVLQHHERLDGSGYPNGTSGPLIMLEARIVAVADVVEAMSSHRPYRPALGVEAALKEIHDGAGVLYDREVVAACECVFAQGFAFDG